MSQAERVMIAFLDYIRAEAHTEAIKRRAKYLATCENIVDSNGLTGKLDPIVWFIWQNSEDENVAIEILEQFFEICGIED